MPASVSKRNQSQVWRKRVSVQRVCRYPNASGARCTTSSKAIWAALAVAWVGGKSRLAFTTAADNQALDPLTLIALHPLANRLVLTLSQQTLLRDCAGGHSTGDLENGGCSFAQIGFRPTVPQFLKLLALRLCQCDLKWLWHFAPPLHLTPYPSFCCLFIFFICIRDEENPPQRPEHLQCACAAQPTCLSARRSRCAPRSECTRRGSSQQNHWVARPGGNRE